MLTEAKEQGKVTVLSFEKQKLNRSYTARLPRDLVSTRNYSKSAYRTVQLAFVFNNIVIVYFKIPLSSWLSLDITQT